MATPGRQDCPPRGRRNAMDHPIPYIAPAMGLTLYATLTSVTFLF